MSNRSNENPGFDQGSENLSDLEHTIADFERLSQELEQQIRIEQQISGISDASHFAYPTFAKAAAVRRDNLLASIADLKAHLEKRKLERSEAAVSVGPSVARRVNSHTVSARQRRKQPSLLRLAEGAV